MKIVIPFLAAIVLLGIDLLTRAAVQGVEQALLATVIKCGANCMRVGRKFLPNDGFV